MRRQIWVAWACMGALGTAAVDAHAQSVIRNPEEHSHIGIDIHGVFDYWWGYGFGGGARVEIPLIHSGFVRSLNNSFGLSLGGDFVYRSGYYGAGFWFPTIVAHLDAQWNFYLTPHWSIFAEVGFAPQFWLGCGTYNCGVFEPWFDAAVGARFHFGSANNGYPALMLRAGNTSVNAGVVF